MKVLRLNTPQKITLGAFCLVALLWLYIALKPTVTDDVRYTYSLAFGLIPLFGGLVGIVQSRIWGGFKSAIGRAVLFISLGLLLWGFGETTWSYYNFVLNVAAPYPSLADIGFAPSIFFWVLGTYHLSQATGAYLSLKRSHKAKLFAVVVPLLLLIPSYYLQISLARGGTIIPDGESLLKTVLDIAYPFGDFLALTFAAVVATLSYKYFGGLYRLAIILLLAGLATMYVGDLLFSYTTTEGTYMNANTGDLILAGGLTLITTGILAFATKPGKLRGRM